MASSVPIPSASLASGDPQSHGEQKGEEQFLLLEEGATNVFVKHLLLLHRRMDLVEGRDWVEIWSFDLLIPC